MTFAECPSCQGEIKLGTGPFMGQKIRCRNCDAQLEIVWLNPVELDWVEEDDDTYEEEADLNDDDYDYREELEDIEEETQG